MSQQKHIFSITKQWPLLWTLQGCSRNTLYKEYAVVLTNLMDKTIQLYFLFSMIHGLKGKVWFTCFP